APGVLRGVSSWRSVMLQFRGSPLIDWEENLPRVPLPVLQRNARAVADRLVVHLAGHAGLLGR
ncbi:hypothetical protein OO014_14985, partial [Intrasporangium calvum]|nr:hypothetical protein [Intrasporangium calvum]